MTAGPAPRPDRADPDSLSVLLVHTVPGGGSHLDWLIERPGTEEERRLIAFRCAHDPLTAPDLEAERIADHRAIYLDYEGPISGGRGGVRRLWRVGCRLLSESGDEIRVVLIPESGGARTVRLVRTAASTWRAVWIGAGAG